MNKILRDIVGGVILVIILILFYLFTFQISHKRLVIKETTSIISVGDLNSKKVKDYYHLYEKATGNNIDDIDKYTKHIKGIDLIYYNDSTTDKRDEDKEVLAINLGWLYPIAKFKEKEYFDDLGKNYFSLKEIYQKELLDKYGIDKKIYMTNYKGYYFISDDVMKLSDYMRLIVRKEINENITDVMEGNTLGEAVIDLSEVAEELSALKVNLDYKDNELILNSYIYGDIEFSEYFEGIPSKDRKYSTYMGKNRVYLTNKNFKELTTFIRSNLNSDMNSTFSLVKMFTGKNIEDYMDKIDGEIVYDYESDQLIVPLKNSEGFQELFGVLARKNGDTYTLNNGKIIEIKDNVIYYNGKMSQGDITPKDDEFFTASINLGLYNLNLDDIYMNMGGKIDDKTIKIRVSIKDSELLEAYKRMGVTGNDQNIQYTD